MDAVFNKLKTKVSSALPGNPLIREYDVGKLIGQAGPNGWWKLYSAKKRSTQQETTVWVMEKKVLESCSANQKEYFLTLLKNGVFILTRMKHPKIVSVVQSLEESRESLAFATEPLFASLVGILGENKFGYGTHHSNKPVGELPDKLVLTDIEIKYGLVQLCEALHFIHHDCHRLHLNVNAHSVLINRFGVWKLGGFEFSQTMQPDDRDPHGYSAGNVDMTLSIVCELRLDTTCVDLILKKDVGPTSDMFSLALLISKLYNNGKSLLHVINDYSVYKQTVEKLPSLVSNLSSIPDNLKEYLKMMLSIDRHIRPTAQQFLRTPYFEDASLSILSNVDNMYQLDNLARSQFYKSLPNSLHTLPKRLCLYRIFPQITEDFSNVHMVPFILPAVLQIIDMVSQDEFVQHILPRIIPVLGLKEPVQIILIYIQNLHILSAKLPVTEFRNYVLPIIQNALDTDNKMIQELCLKCLPTMGKSLDPTILKNSLLPRIQKMCLNTDYSSIRILCLVTIGKILDYFDKWVVVDEILPFLQQVRSRDQSVLVAILCIYRIAFSHEQLGISREKLATRVLPHLIPLSIETNLTLKQYGAYASLIRDMCESVECEQRVKLEQLHGVPDDKSMVKFDDPNESLWKSNNSSIYLMDHIMRSLLDSWEHDNALPNANSKPQPSSLTTHNGFILPMSDAIPTSELTIEQKRQLAAKRDQIERLSDSFSTSALQPVHQTNGSIQSRPTKTGPIDLTSTLINSNLHAINSKYSTPKPPLAIMGGPSIVSGASRPLYDQPNYFVDLDRELMQPFGASTFHKQQQPKMILSNSQSDQIKALSKRDIDDLLG